MGLDDQRRPGAQQRPALCLAPADLPKPQQEQRQHGHREHLAHHERLIQPTQAIDGADIEEGRAQRRLPAARHAPGRGIHERRRQAIDQHGEQLQHERDGRPAQHHQRQRNKQRVRIEDRGRRAVAVIGEAAHAHRQLSAAQPVRQVHDPRRMELRVDGQDSVLPQHRQRCEHRSQREQRKRLPPLRIQPPPDHGEQPGAQQQQGRRPRPVGIHRRVQAQVIHPQIGAVAEANVDGEAVHGLRQREHRLILPHRRVRGKPLRGNLHAVGARQADGVCAVPADAPAQAVGPRGQVEVRSAAIFAVGIARIEPQLRLRLHAVEPKVRPDLLAARHARRGDHRNQREASQQRKDLPARKPAIQVLHLRDVSLTSPSSPAGSPACRRSSSRCPSPGTPAYRTPRASPQSAPARIRRRN